MANIWRIKLAGFLANVHVPENSHGDIAAYQGIREKILKFHKPRKIRETSIIFTYGNENHGFFYLLKHT